MSRNVVDAEVGGDQLLARRRVDAIVARPGNRVRADAHVDLARARGSDQCDEATRGGSANNGIVDHDDALSIQHFTNRVVLHADLRIATGLRRLNEGPPDVVVTDERKLEGKLGFLRISDGSGVGGVGHGEHEIRSGRWPFAGELTSELTSSPIDRSAPDMAVRTREVDVLENALAGISGFERKARANPVAVDREDLSALDVALERGANEIERTRFRGNDPPLTEAPEDEGTPSAGIARGEERVADDDEERERPFDALQRIGQTLVRLLAARACDPMHEDLGIHRRRKDGAHVLELATQLRRVDDVPVMRERDVPIAKPGENGLRVLDRGGARGAVASVPNPGVARELAQGAAIDPLGDEAHGAQGPGRPVLIDGDDARRLLPAMLQRV